jgi:hypothetical protein
MKQRGLSLEQITQETGVELEVLKQFLPKVIGVTVETHKLTERSASTMIEETKVPQKLQPTQSLPNLQHSHIPTFFYNCNFCTNKLCRVNIFTGEKSRLEVPSYQFKGSCCLSQLSGTTLLITGG